MKPTQAELYRRLDQYAELIRKKIKQEFNRLLLAGFDELNVVRTKELTKTIYERVDRMNRQHYADICEWTFEWVYVQYGKDPPDGDWTKVVDDWLKGYDPVTKYVYDAELERKRLRLNEGILASREYQDRPGLEDVVRTAANLLLTQSLQYGLDLIGEMEERAYEAAGGEDGLIQYHSCNDSRTCGECKGYDGQVFRASEAPRIPIHARCRCWYTRFIQPENG